jgi:hypothetical protein
MKIEVNVIIALGILVWFLFVVCLSTGGSKSKCNYALYDSGSNKNEGKFIVLIINNV